MAKNELKGKALHDVHKIVFLLNEYPEKTLSELIEMFQKEFMPAIDINAAFWRAEDMGYLSVNKEENKAKVENIPDSDGWEFPRGVNNLCEQIVYYLEYLARKENDIEENYLNNLALGYLPTDYLVAVKHLLNTRKIAKYEIVDTVEIPVSKKQKGRGKKSELRDETYVFYSLWENAEQQWGKKQFKDTTKLK